MVGPMPYTALQALGGAFFPPGRLSYWKGSFLKELSDDAFEIMIAQFASVPSRFSFVGLEELGGAVSRVGKDETAFGERSARYSFLITSEYIDPAESEMIIRWTRDFWEAMRPFESEAAYVNYLGTEGQDRIRAAYGEKYERLVALKNKYDPTNLFRLNQNIKPTVW